MFSLTIIVNKYYVTDTLGWHDSTYRIVLMILTSTNCLLLSHVCASTQLKYDTALECTLYAVTRHGWVSWKTMHDKCCVHMVWLYIPPWCHYLTNHYNCYPIFTDSMVLNLYENLLSTAFVSYVLLSVSVRPNCLLTCYCMLLSL